MNSHKLTWMIKLATLKFTIILEGVGAWHLGQLFERIYAGSPAPWPAIWIMLWLVLATGQLALFIWYMSRAD